MAENNSTDLLQVSAPEGVADVEKRGSLDLSKLISSVRLDVIAKDFDIWIEPSGSVKVLPHEEIYLLVSESLLEMYKPNDGNHDK